MTNMRKTCMSTTPEGSPRSNALRSKTQMSSKTDLIEQDIPFFRKWTTVTWLTKALMEFDSTAFPHFEINLSQMALTWISSFDQ